ncbi:MAG TPA: lipoyl(octanoyl) transferase LipB [Ignavibacteriales bacterium]|nr:lipoyl(octanoyl) transferase LipB [Ignavibacteriales bacterium]
MQTEKQYTSRNLEYCDLGLIDYDKAWDLQKEVFEQRKQGLTKDTLFLLEHPHTYTLGKVADKANLVGDEEYLKKNHISVYEIDRGGDITYHGPGQIVGYPIINLAEWKEDAHLYLRSLEDVIMKVCGDYGLTTRRDEKYTGVWIEDRKICAIGIKISKWVTMHGFAFNVNSDLEMFNGIIPCGIRDKQVTSLKKELGREIDLGEVKIKIIKYFMEVFGYADFKEIPAESYTEKKI